MPEQSELFPEKSPTPAKKKDKPAVKKSSVAKKPAVRRRKKAATEVEDYYALLGVSSDADLATIKQNYIKMVKKYPPESHAEKFRKIRHAYEIFQDEQKRKEYDILFLYGESVADLVAEAKAGARLTIAKSKLLERAIKIDPFHKGAQLALAEAYLIHKGRDSFEERFDIIKDIFGSENIFEFLMVKIRLLFNYCGSNEAFSEMRRLQETEPRFIGKHFKLCVDIYSDLGREPELLADFALYHKSLICPQIEDIVIYIGWIKVADIFFREDKLPEARRAAEKFIKSFSTQAQREQLAKLFAKEYQEAFEDKNIRLAKVLVDLACLADRNNKKLKQFSQELQKVSTLIDEFSRAINDDKIFTQIILEILSDFVREFDIEDSMFGMMLEHYDEHGSGIFAEVLSRINADKLYAAGIFRLKKKYPLLYRRYQTQLEKMLTEKTLGMNREERRSYRY